MLEIDHVVIPVAGLEEAADALFEEHGLASVAGGVHPGHGTGNRIIPLGSAYLELMGVVDPAEAAESPMGRWVLARAGTGPGLVCLRTDDMESVSTAIGQSPQEMARRRPDGVELRWRLAGLAGALALGRPFFIQWDVADADHPGRAEAQHRVTPTGIAWVELAGWKPDGDLPGLERLDLRPVGGPGGVHRVAVATTGGELVVGISRV